MSSGTTDIRREEKAVGAEEEETKEEGCTEQMEKIELKSFTKPIFCVSFSAAAVK